MNSTKQPLMRSRRILGFRYRQYDCASEVKQSRTTERREWLRDQLEDDSTPWGAYQAHLQRLHDEDMQGDYGWDDLPFHCCCC